MRDFVSWKKHALPSRERLAESASERGMRETATARVLKASASSERGVTLTELTLALGLAGAFIAGSVWLYGATAGRQFVTESSFDVTEAISEVEAAWPEYWRRVGGSRVFTGQQLESAITERGTKRGTLYADYSPMDDVRAPKAFRVGLRDIPYSRVEDFCLPLRARLLRSKKIDSAACIRQGGASRLEARVCKKGTACGGALRDIDLAQNWEGAPPLLRDFTEQDRLNLQALERSMIAVDNFLFNCAIQNPAPPKCGANALSGNTLTAELQAAGVTRYKSLGPGHSTRPVSYSVSLGGQDANSCNRILPVLKAHIRMADAKCRGAIVEIHPHFIEGINEPLKKTDLDAYHRDPTAYQQEILRRRTEAGLYNFHKRSR